MTVSGAVTLAGGTFTVATAPPWSRPAATQVAPVASGTLSLAGGLAPPSGDHRRDPGGYRHHRGGRPGHLVGGTLAGGVTNAGTLAISGSVEYLGAR